MDRSRPRWQTVVFWILSVILCLLFLMAGGTKLAGAKNAVEGFEHLRLPQWFRIVTGVIEVAAAVLVIIPKTRFWGAALIVCTMIGATATHLRIGETWTALGPVVFGIMAFVLAWTHRPPRLAGGAAA